MQRHQRASGRTGSSPTRLLPRDDLGGVPHPAVRDAERVDERAADEVPAGVGHAEAADECRPRVEPGGTNCTPVIDAARCRQRDLLDARSTAPGRRRRRRAVGRRGGAFARPELVARRDGHSDPVADLGGRQPLRRRVRTEAAAVVAGRVATQPLVVVPGRAVRPRAGARDEQSDRLRGGAADRRQRRVGRQRAGGRDHGRLRGLRRVRRRT